MGAPNLNDPASAYLYAGADPTQPAAPDMTAYLASGGFDASGAPLPGVGGTAALPPVPVPAGPQTSASNVIPGVGAEPPLPPAPGPQPAAVGAGVPLRQGAAAGPPGGAGAASGGAPGLPTTAAGMQQLALGSLYEGAPAPAGMTEAQRMGVIGTIGNQTPAGGMLKSGRSSTSQTSGMVTTPEMRRTREAQIAHGTDAANATADLGELKARHATEAADLAQTQAAELAKTNADQEKQAAANAKDLADRQARFERQQTEYGVAAKSLDPDRLLNSGGNRAIAALSAALGAFGATLGHTENFALKQINAAIDRDYQGQKDQLSAKREQLTLSQQSMQNVRQLYQDDTARALAHKANMLTAFVAQGDVMAKRQGGEQTAKQYAGMRSQMLAEIDEKNLGAQHAEAAHKANSTTTSYTAGPTAADQKNAQLDYLNKLAGVQKNWTEAFGDKVSEQDRTTLNKAQEKVIPALQAMSQSEQLIKAIRGQVGERFRDPAYNSILQSVKAAMVHAETGADAGQKEREAAAERWEGKWYQMSDEDQIKAIRATVGALNQGARAALSVVKPGLKAPLRGLIENSGYNQGEFDAIERGSEFVPRDQVSAPAGVAEAGRLGARVRGQ